MSRAARLPAPMALITVAAPVTTSPPAQTRSLVVRPVASSLTTTVPWRVVSSPSASCGDQRVRRGADGDDHHVAVDDELGAGLGDRAGGGRWRPARPAPSGCTPCRSPSPCSSARIAGGVGEELEVDALLVGVLHLLAAGGQLGVGAAVDDVAPRRRPGAGRSAPSPWPRCRRPPRRRACPP